jgi:hypothetical protein
MHARLQDRVGLCDLRVAQLVSGEIGLHDVRGVCRTA